MSSASVAKVVRPHAKTFVVVVLLQAIGGLAGLVPLLAVAELGRLLLSTTPDEPARLWAVVAAGVVGLAVRLAAEGIAARIAHLLDAEVQLALRRSLADRLRCVPLGWLATRRTGELAKVVGDDVGAVHPFIAHTPGALVTAFVVPLACLIYLITVDWRLTLITLVPVALAIALLPLMMTPPRAREQKEFDLGMEHVASSAVEFVQGIAEVKTFGGDGRAHRSFRTAVDAFVGSFARMVRGLSWPAAGMQLLLSPPMVLFAVLCGGVWRLEHQMPAADLLPFLLLGLGLTAPLNAMIGHSFEDVQTARRAVARIDDVLATPSLPEPERPALPDGSRVELRQVRFGYTGREVLRGVDLALEARSTTALVGRSGSGKSTLATLLPRFYDPTEGAVVIGGVDVRDLATHDLHRMMSFVFQDSVLLRTSVAENIALAVPDADRHRVIEAARRAHIHERIMALPHGYDTVLGEHVTLSGGETQRIAIARALLADTPILVLDEATAFADPVTEQAIREALDALQGEKTILVIAHRLETITGADTVAVLENGKVIESGTPDDLMTAGGAYAELWEAHRAASDSVSDRVRQGVRQ